MSVFKVDTEEVDIVDDDGRILRQSLKTQAHKNGDLHKTVIGYLKYDEDWALVRQAADRQDAGQLVAPVGGHVKSGESDLEALFREAEEEIGTRHISHKHVGNARFHRQVIGRNENHLFITYEIMTGEPISLGPEAITIERFTKNQLKQALVERPRDFGDSYYFILERFYPSYLPPGYTSKWPLT
jgi:8-oxo-dGTP pyrophosphatase MutT (NUDIX family)